MALVVTGIAPNHAIGPLEDALRAAGLSLDHLQVVEPGDESTPITYHPLASTAILGGLDTGTGVPGLTGGATLGDSAAFFPDESVASRLAGFAIPDDELQNYVDALTAGRCVIAYFARPETLDQVEAAFHAAGLAKIKRF